MTHVDEESALERADEVRPSLGRDESLANSPDSVSGLFVVPRAIASES
jgi:Asp-tRNA(Asn)/Glu-tRNA(Gln) amidotransferase C subunit